MLDYLISGEVQPQKLWDAAALQLKYVIPERKMADFGPKV